MTDNFGHYVDAVQAASVTYLKSAPSSWRWEVRQTQIGRTMLQFGVDGGAGLVHGVTDAHLMTVILQVTEFEDRVWLDGVPCPSRALAILPPETHFTFVRTGPEKWLSWSMRKEEALANKLQPLARPFRPFRTEKTMVMLSMEAVSRFRAIAHAVFGQGNEFSPDPSVAEAMFHQVEQACESNDGTLMLPGKDTRSAEQIVFRALRFVQAKNNENIEIADLARASEVNYRTLLRAFERYLKVSPKRYLKLRQINGVYHGIRRNSEASALADILAANGVSEFGRFAGEYRAVFQELPSVTYKRQARAIDIDRVNTRRNGLRSGLHS